MITLSALKRSKIILHGLKKLLILIIVLFVITLVTWYLVLNLRYMGEKRHPVDIFYYINLLIPSSLMCLAGIIFLIFRFYTIRYVSLYFHYIKNTYFHEPHINRNHFLKLLGIHEENLRSLGYNYTKKEFTYDNFVHSFRGLQKKEKLHHIIKLVGIDEVLGS